MIDLKTVLKGQETEIKGNKYLSTERYVAPFVEILKNITTNFKVYAKPADQLIGDSITYNKVLILAILPETWEDYNHAIGFCYALDVKKPVAKFFTCLVKDDNIIAYEKGNIIYQAIEPETNLKYSGVRELYGRTRNLTILEALKDATLERDDRWYALGKIIEINHMSSMDSDFCKVKLAKIFPVEVFESLYVDPESKHYTTDYTITGLDLLKAFIDILDENKKDIINKFEKAYLAFTLVHAATN
jgi:hypothetical protein